MTHGKTQLTFGELRAFVEERMKLSHIYQPLLIRILIELGGSSTIRQLALSLLCNDESQIMYYEKRLKEMPLKVLSKHGILSKDGELVKLNVEKLSLEQRAELKKLCEQKMQEFIVSRGIKIWDYRLIEDAPIPDSLRYLLLKEAKGRCALCGATRDDRPLDIDHIIPRSRKGKTDYSNLQVLCSKCNRSKRDKDDADLRRLVETGVEADCTFCEARSSDRVILENELAFAILDKYPVTQGHTLIIPKRHFRDYFDITKSEYDAVYDLLRVRKRELTTKDSSILGFNVGTNSGEVAGMTILHSHTHLIPRRNGDMDDPRGGVRGVIPSKRIY